METQVFNEQTDSNLNCRYFIAKVNSFPSLKQAVLSSRWACTNRSSSPQPVDILCEAFQQGTVIIIFSVSNCQGWHGYAKMTSSPELETTPTSIPSEDSSFNNDSVQTVVVKSTNDKDNKQELSSQIHHYFCIKWLVHFTEFGEQCMSARKTDELFCIEKLTRNKIPLNKSRNWQELDLNTGEQLCVMLDEFYSHLRSNREEKQLLKVKSKPFFDEPTGCSTDETWRKIVNQVENDLGKVILACPFGSQRYNLHTKDSDTDMFIVYQGKTRDALGFNPPKQTVKNQELESCDYTIHEVYRYCELLLSGDARCVETLYLHDSTVVQSSPEWEELKACRHLFLNRDCLDKYLRDAQGSKGTKYFKKWCLENPDRNVLPPKLCKMLYIIVRLLQNARNIVNGDDFVVYRDNVSPDRECLMKIRAGDVPVQYALDLITELEKDIINKKDNVQNNKTQVQQLLENWILQLRYKDFKQSDFKL